LAKYRKGVPVFWNSVKCWCIHRTSITSITAASTRPAAPMLRLSTRALRRARIAAPRSTPLALSRGPSHLQSQVRTMGFFSDLKNQLKNEMEKNEELKKSFEELEKTKEQFKNVEKAAKEKMSEMSSMTEEAAKNIQEQASQASQKIKESYEENAKAAAKVKKEKEDTKEKEAQAAGAAAEGAEQGEVRSKPFGRILVVLNDCSKLTMVFDGAVV
jgi:methyl-accepting chemotaxis protein